MSQPEIYQSLLVSLRFANVAFMCRSVDQEYNIQLVSEVFTNLDYFVGDQKFQKVHKT